MTNWHHDRYLYVTVFPKGSDPFVANPGMLQQSHVVLIEEMPTQYRVFKHRYDPKITPNNRPLVLITTVIGDLRCLAEEKGLALCVLNSGDKPHQMEEGPDGSTSDLFDLISQIMDTTHYEEDDMLDDLVLFIERSGLSERAQAWLHGRLDGTVKGRTT